MTTPTLAKLFIAVLSASLISTTVSCANTPTCAAGTIALDGVCVIDSTRACGPYTSFANGVCVGATCGAGTLYDGTACVADLQECAEGTTRAGDKCIASPRCGAGTSNVNGECVATIQSCSDGASLNGTQCAGTIRSCAAGTSLAGSACVATIQTCGTGTMLSGSSCVSSELTCGTGTAQVGKQCNVNLSTVCSTDTTGAGGTTCVGRVTCGTGTQRQGDVCNPSYSTICASGTTSSNGKCVLDGATACGAGTVFSNGKCEVPVQSSSLQAFTASSTLKSSYDHEDYYYMTGYRTRHRVIITDLSQGNADAWASNEIAPVGMGGALHLKIDGLSLSGSTIIPITNASLTGGACKTGLQPASQPSPASSGTYANFFSWNLSNPTLTACAVGGSVKLESVRLSGVDSVRVTVNTQFNDGTTWVDRVFEMPYH